MAQEEVVVSEAPAMESPKKPIQEPPPPPTDETPVAKSGSFKEESNVAADLQEPEKKALDELKSLLQAAISNNELATPPPPAAVPAAPAADEPAKPEEPVSPAETEVQDKAVVVDDDGAKTVEAIESTVVPAAAPASPEKAIADANDVSIWGVPLLKDERSDTVLLKFLMARDFKPKEALSMLKNTIKWRNDFGIESLLKEDLAAPELEKAVFMSGVSKQGHPVCYNVYEKSSFGDQEKRQRFLRWRIQYLERGIRDLLDFAPGAVSTMVQVTDLKNSPGLLLKGELRDALDLLQDNFPEFVAKQIFINVPWWYIAFNKMISPFLTQRTKSKFVFAGPAKSAETLFSYVSPEQVPVQFGGLNGDGAEFSTADAVTEVNMKPAAKHIIEIPVTEKCLLVWELRVPGWDVSVGAEFVPSSEEAYTVIIQKSRKIAAGDEAVAKGGFNAGEAGKLVIAVDNAGSKKKKLLYRYKTKEFSADSNQL